MKKCPYCAEDIQDEAKKCKHCGEWLSVSLDGINISDEPDAVQEKIKKDEINTDLNTTANESQITLEVKNPEVKDDEDASKYLKILGAKILIKKPGKKCKHCNSDNVKRTFLGGSGKIMGYICLFAGLGSTLSKPPPLSAIIWILIGIASIITPKYYCKACKKRFS